MRTAFKNFQLIDLEQEFEKSMYLNRLRRYNNFKKNF